MDLCDEFFALIDTFNGERLEYGVCGGIALAIHGFPRFTKDIDVLVHPKDLERALAVAAKRGFVVMANPLRFDVGKPHAREDYQDRIGKRSGRDEEDRGP